MRAAAVLLGVCVAFNLGRAYELFWADRTMCGVPAWVFIPVLLAVALIMAGLADKALKLGVHL